jgi:Zn-dependent protease with chaperone function
VVNGYFIAALSGLVVVEAIGLVAALLNLRALSLEVPEEFAGVYDAETYRRSQTYTRVKTRFGIADSLFDLAILLAFWVGGGFGWLDGLVGSWRLGPLWAGLVFLVILGAARGILSLPFSIWGVFVIEERFGFNRTSRRTFALDLVKGLGLAIALGVPLLIGFLALFKYGGGFAWIYAWVAVVAFSFVMQILAPTLIMPLFNKFTPLDDGELKDAILAYAQQAGFPLKGVFSIDASRRSTKGNAFFTGFGRAKRIALFDTLIQRHTAEELVAVLAHEIGHYKNRHRGVGAGDGAVPRLVRYPRASDRPVCGLRRRFAVGVRRRVVRGSSSAAPAVRAIGRRRGALPVPRASGRRLRDVHHRSGRSAGRRAQTFVQRQPVQSHAAPVLRVPQLLAPAGARKGALAGVGPAGVTGVRQRVLRASRPSRS